MLSIVLPAYKEKENLAILIPQIEQEFQNDQIEIIVVDDHSMDGTRELIETLKQTYSNLILLERAGLLGIGSALRDGYNLAKGEYILSSDADCSFSAADMRAIYTKIQTRYDLVLGYRVAKGFDRPVRGIHAIQGWIENSIISPLSNGLIGLVSGVGLKNYNTNFRIIRSSIWKRIQTVEDRQFWLFEMIVRAKQAGARISEIPVTFSPRNAGESKVSFLKQAPTYLLKLLRITWFERKV